MGSSTSFSSAEGPRTQPRFDTVLMCSAAWEKWFARSAGRAALLSTLLALVRTAESQEAGQGTLGRAVAEECRTPSPNTCRAKPRRMTLGNDGELERLDLSVIYHIFRPSDRPFLTGRRSGAASKLYLLTLDGRSLTRIPSQKGEAGQAHHPRMRE